MSALCTFSKLFLLYEYRGTYCFAILDIIRKSHPSTSKTTAERFQLLNSSSICTVFSDFPKTTVPNWMQNFFPRKCYCRTLQAYGRENVNDLHTCPNIFFALLFIQIITQLRGFRFICLTVDFPINLNSYAASVYLIQR